MKPKQHFNGEKFKWMNTEMVSTKKFKPWVKLSHLIWDVVQFTFKTSKNKFLLSVHLSPVFFIDYFIMYYVYVSITVSYTTRFVKPTVQICFISTARISLLCIIMLVSSPGASSSCWGQLLLWNNRHLAPVQTHKWWVDLWSSYDTHDPHVPSHYDHTFFRKLENSTVICNYSSGLHFSPIGSWQCVLYYQSYCITDCLKFLRNVLAKSCGRGGVGK